MSIVASSAHGAPFHPNNQPVKPCSLIKAMANSFTYKYTRHAYKVTTKNVCTV